MAVKFMKAVIKNVYKKHEWNKNKLILNCPHILRWYANDKIKFIGYALIRVALKWWANQKKFYVPSS